MQRKINNIIQRNREKRGEREREPGEGGGKKNLLGVESDSRRVPSLATEQIEEREFGKGARDGRDAERGGWKRKRLGL